MTMRIEHTHTHTKKTKLRKICPEGKKKSAYESWREGGREGGATCEAI